MRVRFEELQRAANELLTLLEALHGPEVEIPFEEYWDTHAPERYSPYAADQELGLGELGDDWERLRRILAADSDPIQWHLSCLSAVLRAMADSPLEFADR